MIPFDIASCLSKIGFLITFLAGLFLIYLTMAHIENMVTTYKRIIVYFAVSGMLFSGLEVISRPFAHNYNGAIVFFSTSKLDLSQENLQILISIWSGFYSLTIAFISFQFVYRYLSLFHVNSLEYFDGFGTVVWMVYPLIPGAIYSIAFHIFCQPDEYTDSYVRWELFETYGIAISEIPRFFMVPFDASGTLRMESVINISVDLFLIGFHYLIILYCGLQMHFNMRKELRKFSAPQRRLQRQFFKALIVQSMGPTIFLVLPAAPVLLTPVLSPLLDVKVSWQTGWMFTLIGLYPPFDSIAFMIIVSEYKNVIRKQLKLLIGDKTPVASIMYSKSSRTL
ncbi:Protein CBG24876 [Caenorhabditis briggsae]|uniref:Seven TM Receptor n=2 Tax=Caenorhabditis briggsae TaxID=6238 RepID=A0AAE9D1W9_CAEBR|nr:Protein CBG24876 [Caenorhabditis briggsae]ULT91721.1 hypothetical protein L3Y34_009400 [Caenorhabditis briggsae]CAP21386.1 Protein CBG24876 [Caenorhabditis briggsae]